MRRLGHLGTAGATALEFALAAPVALTLLLGTIETGRLMWTQNALEQGVAAAGRYAMVHPSASASEVAGVARAGMGAIGGGDVAVTAAQETVGTVRYATITAGCEFRFLPTFVPLAPVRLASKARVPLP
jgi:Flp pilus assembly protein TadG